MSIATHLAAAIKRHQKKQKPKVQQMMGSKKDPKEDSTANVKSSVKK